jgi:aminoglycoside 2''-phosphotransferase
MVKTNRYIETIRSKYPAIRIRSAEINQDGQYNDVLVVNEELIFRFAKVPHAIKTLEREVIVLRYLQPKITLPIPNPIYINTETETVGEAFVGYSMIQGIPLWRNNYQQISDHNVRQKMADQLAGFLKEIHQVPIDEIPIELEIEDKPEYWAEMYKKIKEKLFSYMRSDAKREISEHFETYLLELKKYEFIPKLRHGDFGTGNILFDPDSQKIAGIIDFGGVGVGDPAGDYAGLYISFGEEFYRNCYSANPDMKRALEKVKFYCGSFALQEALFGYENDDQEAFQSGMKEYI